jgi:hypothetical protein
MKLCVIWTVNGQFEEKRACELNHPCKLGVGLGYCASKWLGHGHHSFFVEKLIVNSFREFSFTKCSFYDVSY